MCSDSPAELAWSLVIPVKVLALAKSRLTGLAGPLRSRLALAMAADTVAAAVAAVGAAAVLVVTDDPEVARLAASLGAQTVPDAPAAGLNAALCYGAARAEQARPGQGRAGLAADLPALRPGELAAALAWAARKGAAFVPDADGSGTTLYAAAAGVPFQPRFGVASRSAHLAADAAEIGTDLPGLRRDVDTPADLRAAAALGLGPRTAAVLAAADATLLA